MITEMDLESVLKTQLQKQLEFELNNRVFKRGKLALYKIETYENNYEISFIFEKGTGTETFKIPYPFKFEYYTEPNSFLMFMDYRIYSFCNDNKTAEKLLLEYNKVKKSKYFNKILKIKCKVH